MGEGQTNEAQNKQTMPTKGTGVQNTTVIPAPQRSTQVDSEFKGRSILTATRMTANTLSQLQTLGAKPPHLVSVSTQQNKMGKNSSSPLTNS